MEAPGMSPLGGPLLASARSRLAIAGAAIFLLWIAVLAGWFALNGRISIELEVKDLQFNTIV